MCVVGPAKMGRSAAKVEGLDFVLNRLHDSTVGLAPQAYAKSGAAGGLVSSEPFGENTADLV